MMLCKPESLTESSLFLNQRITSFALIFLLLLSVYWGSFHNGWQLDDRFNITENPGLLIDDLSPKNLWGTFFANQGKETRSLFRPLPCLSFALNWYVGKDNPFGYHVVNFGCHIATIWALYLLMVQLLMVLYKEGINKTSVENVALLAAVLWAVNPIQTQAVTYIVQRMAMMSALFYVLGMLFYVKARMAETAQRKLPFAVICFVCFLCGMGSKENAFLLPVSLALVEWIFFYNGSLAFFKKPKALLAGIIIITTILLTVYFAFDLKFDFLFKGYKTRSFTMTERMMTQPRIILFYLSQIFLPLPERLSIAHDVAVSTSLFQPWTTLPSIILVLGAIAGAIIYARRYPLASFAILFYFLNHAVESSFLPLELVFEHRNYLPSFFLFLPISSEFYFLLMKFSRLGVIYIGLICSMIIIIIALGFFTHTRNKAWATPESLWRDATLKAPGNNRPFVFLGIELAWREHPTPDDYRHALVLFNHSLSLSGHRSNEYVKILGNIAGVYRFEGDYSKAIEIFRKAIAIDPKFNKNRFDMIKALVMANRLDEAKEEAEYLVSVRPYNADYMNLKGFILLWQGDNEKALSCFQKALIMGSSKKDLYLNLGVALTRTGYLDRGRWFLSQAIDNSPRDLIPIFAMIENCIKNGDTKSANRFAKKIVEIMPVPVILNKLNSLSEDHRFVPISISLIRPVLLDVMISVLNHADRPE